MSKKGGTIFLIVFADDYEFIDDMCFSLSDLCKKMGISKKKMKKIISEHRKFKNRYFEKIF